MRRESPEKFWAPEPLSPGAGMRLYYRKAAGGVPFRQRARGVLINQSIHTLDLLVRFLGRPRAAEATLANHHLKGVIEVEDTLEAWVDFGGACAVLFATTAHCSDSPVLLELTCENAVFRMEETEVCCVWKDGRKEQISFSAPAAQGKAYWGSSHETCIRDFYRAWEEKRPYQNDIESVRNTVDLMLGIYESAQGSPSCHTVTGHGKGICLLSIKKNCLTEAEKAEITALQDDCFREDGLQNAVFLSNELNVDRTAPCFIWAM